MKYFYRITQICGGKGSGRTNFILSQIINKNVLYLSSKPFPIRRYLDLILINNNVNYKASKGDNNLFINDNKPSKGNNNLFINDNKPSKGNNNLFINDNKPSTDNNNLFINDNKALININDNLLETNNDKYLLTDNNKLWLYPNIINILNKLKIKIINDQEELNLIINKIYFELHENDNNKSLINNDIKSLHKGKIIGKDNKTLKNKELIEIFENKEPCEILTNNIEYLIINELESPEIDINKLRFISKKIKIIIIITCRKLKDFDLHFNYFGFYWEYIFNTKIHIENRNVYILSPMGVFQKKLIIGKNVLLV